MNKKCIEIRDLIPENKVVVLIGGCFDLLHIGHVTALEQAKKLGDVLIVAILADDYVRSYKGELRPVINENHRAYLVRSLRCVDYVFISQKGSADPNLLSIIRPDKIVFGIEDDIVRNEKAKLRESLLRKKFPSVEIVYLQRFADVSVSTTAIINMIRKA